MYELNVHKCQKFRTFENKADARQALVFLKLLDNSCPREDALKFCKRRICRFDTTKKLVGPPKFRMIKNTTPGKGWIFPEEVIYDLGKHYEMPPTEEDRAFQQFFSSNKLKIVQEQQQQMEIVNKFMNEIDGQLNMKYNTMKELKSKIKNVRTQQETYRNTPVNYLKYQGQRYIQLYDIFKKHFDNDLLGFETQFPKTVQEKTKRNEDFFIQANKKPETANLQKKFIKLQNEGEIIAKLTQQEGKNEQGFQIKSLSHINDVKNLAMEFNKTQYVFDDEKQKQLKRNSVHILRLNQRLKGQNQKKVSDILAFQDKLDKLVTNRIDSITRGSDCKVDYEQINSLKQKTETARHKEFTKIQSYFTPRLQQMNQRAKSTQQTVRKLQLSNRSLRKK